MLTLHNVPCVKRVAQSLHSTGLLMGPSHHFDDAALPQHKICFRQACPRQLFSVLHDSAACLCGHGINQSKSQGGSRGCATSIQQMRLTSKGICEFASHHIECRKALGPGYRRSVCPITRRAPNFSSQPSNHSPSTDQVLELQQADALPV